MARQRVKAMTPAFALHNERARSQGPINAAVEAMLTIRQTFALTIIGRANRQE